MKLSSNAPESAVTPKSASATASKGNAGVLGYVKLSDGKIKAVHPMSDVFAIYMYNNEDNWETLVDVINLLVERYRSEGGSAPLLTGKIITVKTQFALLLAKARGTGEETVTSREQDIRIDEEDEQTITFVELHNAPNIKEGTPQEAVSTKSMVRRGLEYYCLQISRGTGQIFNQIWLMKGNNEDLMHGDVYSFYRLSKESNNQTYPIPSGILYVNLLKLAKEDSQAGSLAKFLAKGDASATDQKVANIISKYKETFKDFKEQQEVKEIMSFDEKRFQEGIQTGIQTGIVRGKIEFCYFTLNYSPEKIADALEISIEEVCDVINLLEGGTMPA